MHDQLPGATEPELKFHEYAEDFPRMSDERLEALAKSIKKNDLRDPIALRNGEILDGRHRYLAARSIGYAFKPTDFYEFEGTDDEAFDFVYDKNFERRDLTINERAFLAEKRATRSEGRPKTVSAETVSLAEAAAQAGTSRVSAARAREIRKTESPGLIEAARTNQVGLRTAAAVARLSPDEREAAVAGGPQGIREAAASARRIEPSPEQRAIKHAVASQDFVRQLVMAVKTIEGLASTLASGQAGVLPAQERVVGMAVERLRGGVEWIATLVKGDGFSDDALAAWLSGGGRND